MKARTFLVFFLMLSITALEDINAFGKDRENDDTPQKIYTIQMGSFLTLDRAQNEFNSLMGALTNKYRSFLRVEKIGKFYTVRIGEFESYRNAENFIESAPLNILKTNIIKAFLKYDRLRSCICY
ncbi:MAG: SPOR domain-containing protein [Nitrospiraceae bacterium]|nr:MAG: SPOR domain-containing protein [Nitrospiraceae bacterium]UCH46231.1 MAG: SPOR domain-containing protein [Nitrospiraceae bacterium]